MRSVDVLMINRNTENERDVIRIVEDASRYFPSRTWDEVRYRGEVSLEQDVKIIVKGESFGAFLFRKLIERIGREKDSDRLMNLLLGITLEPIVNVYHFFDGKNFKRTTYLVHDYVAESVGVVSLFRVNEKSSSKVVAHGLGHSRGLRHHLEPIDLMYSELLKFPTLQVEGFCRFCLRRLERDKRGM